MIVKQRAISTKKCWGVTYLRSLLSSMTGRSAASQNCCRTYACFNIKVVGQLKKLESLYSFDFHAMGTECVLHLYADSVEFVENVAQLAMHEIFRIERKYSRFNSDSLLSQINQAAHFGTEITVDTETADLMDYAFSCHKLSDGLFDITSGLLSSAWDYESEDLPNPITLMELLHFVGMDKLRWSRPILNFSVAGMELDFGGIGKEYAADQVVALCREQGIKSGLVELGGDIAVIGAHPNESPWVINIRHPRRGDVALSVVKLHHGALATSGDYERFIEVDGVRYCHLLNPYTGWPIKDGLSSISVVTDRCIVAGSLATITMLKGSSEWLSTKGVPFLCANQDGEVETNTLTIERAPAIAGAL